MNIRLSKLILLSIFLQVGTTSAAELRIKLTKNGELPLANAVVKLEPRNHKVKIVPQNKVIDQINKEFVPRIVIVIQGGDINFPNKDNIKHHVYSFSDAKQFELPLYEGVLAESVNFEKPGVVVLGCNIHDWMRGYIYVTDSPYTMLTNREGTVSFESLPEDTYKLSIWHPGLNEDLKNMSYTLRGEDSLEINRDVVIKPVVKIRRNQNRRRNRYD
ncbi:methylamine utilization protein [Aliikangiella sp. G2MR2-5]|uniref:methylamine utilization protein n=1 Tax=Aliikangiella sp. G2MR2-5 TaxID=2788943 RepID=UPI0018A97F5D|nr:methylamine utilization protein [Aliikangiella sp. G2MR2-5]